MFRLAYCNPLGGGAHLNYYTVLGSCHLRFKFGQGTRARYLDTLALVVPLKDVFALFKIYVSMKAQTAPYTGQVNIVSFHSSLRLRRALLSGTIIVVHLPSKTGHSGALPLCSGIITTSTYHR